MVKIICECGTEMIPSTDEQGEPEFAMPIATLTVLGKTTYAQYAYWYYCPNKECEKSVSVIPDYPKTGKQNG